jgi:hypothetical protein
MRRKSFLLTGGGLLGLCTLSLAPSPARTASGSCPELVGAVVINELLVNPTGTDGGQEWVELYNPGATDITLTGWAFQRGKSSSTPMKTRHTFGASAVIPAGGYYILGDTALTSPTPDEVTTTASTLDLGNGNTNADAVQLLDCDGELIDVIVYGKSPNSDGWTDETGALVADADLAPEPGEGEVLARIDDGADTNVSATDVCADSVSTPDAKNRTNCAETVPPDTGDTGIVDTGDTSPPDSGGDSGGDSGTTTLCTAGTPGGLVINEVLYDPTDDATGEYIELYNKGGSPIGLGGWTLNAAKSSWAKQITFSETDEIPAGGYLVVHDGGVTVSAGSAVAVANLDLGNAGTSGDAVRLDDCEGRIIDTVIYGSNNTDSFVDDSGAVATSYAPKAKEGEAIRRDALGTDTDQSAVDFTVGAPTPGAATPGGGGGDPDECVVLGGVVINELLPNSAGTDNADWLELYNPGAADVTLTGWTLEYGTSTYSSAKSLSDVVIPAGGLVLVHDDGFTPPDGVTGFNLSIDLGTGSNSDAVRVVNCLGEPVDTVVYSDPNENSWVDDSGAVATSFAPKSGSEESIGRRVDGVDTDLSGDDFTLYLVSEVTPGQPNPVPFDCAADGELDGLVINEIMTTPDTALAPGEWIELLNVSGRELTLTGWTLNTGKSSYDKSYALDALTVPADGYVLVYDSDFSSDVSTLAPDALTMMVELDLGNATSNADAVQLQNCDGDPVDTLVYGKANTDAFLDDAGNIAESIATISGTGESIGRRVNGADSDLSFEDFTVFDVAEVSPGFENPEPPPCDVSGNGLVLLNEVLADAAGADAGQHWIELVNLGTADIDLGGWEVQVSPSTWLNFGEGLTLPGGTILPAGGFLVIHEADAVFLNLPEGAPTLVVAAGDLDLGNGSSEDGLRLMDCGGDEADALAYGPTGTAGVELDCGNAAFPTLAPSPGESQTLGRSAGAGDTDQCSDFTLLPTMSPGAANASEDCVPTDDAPKSGCRGRGSSTADPCGGTTAYEPPGRCATAPFGGLEAIVLALALLRRRRP